MSHAINPAFCHHTNHQVCDIEVVIYGIAFIMLASAAMCGIIIIQSIIQSVIDLFNNRTKENESRGNLVNDVILEIELAIPETSSNNL